MTVDNVLYLHGFNSHPDSFKARLTAQACAALPLPPRFIAPHVAVEPSQAMATIERILDECQGKTALIGSSLGGFYATCVAEQRGLERVALINPAVMPARVARQFEGQQHYNPETDSRVVIERAYVDQLEALQQDRITQPQRYLVMLGAQDEVLDHRLALAYYRDATILLDPAGHHTLERYAEYVPRVLAHLGLID